MFFACWEKPGKNAQTKTQAKPALQVSGFLGWVSLWNHGQVLSNYPRPLQPYGPKTLQCSGFVRGDLDGWRGLGWGTPQKGRPNKKNNMVSRHGGSTLGSRLVHEGHDSLAREKKIR